MVFDEIIGKDKTSGDQDPNSDNPQSDNPCWDDLVDITIKPDFPDTNPDAKKKGKLACALPDTMAETR